jgi:hypothetical protein
MLFCLTSSFLWQQQDNDDCVALLLVCVICADEPGTYSLKFSETFCPCSISSKKCNILFYIKCFMKILTFWSKLLFTIVFDLLIKAVVYNCP